MEINKIIIGLEVHIELSTKSKMFCGCNAGHFGEQPNTQTCPVCLGLPGALPVPNKKAIESAILLGTALGCKINKKSRFDRKNYFYPDLPKGYQISQYDMPFAVNGELKLKTLLQSKQNSKLKSIEEKIIRIKRVHLEEDTGKLIHTIVDGEKVTLIDFNRGGVPLVEIVTEPDMNSSDEAKQYLETLQRIVQSLEISSADMEKGMMRCEPTVNLEISDGNTSYFTPLVELKNINSFRFVKKAIDFEIDRQFKEFEETKIEKQKGNKTTRGWDEEKGETVLQRIKEEANDYRYFPEPDIPPFQWADDELKNYELRIKNYELPEIKIKRFINSYGLSDYQANILTADKVKADYYEQSVKIGKEKNIEALEVANVVINKKAKEGMSSKDLIDFILLSKETKTVSDDEINKEIDKLLSENPEVVESYKKGKPQALGLIVGLIKKETGIVVPFEKITGRIQ